METEKARGNWIDPRHAAIPPDEIENWLNDEIEAGIAPSSLHRHYRTLRRVLQVAVDKQRIVSNPCDRVEPPRVPRREMVFLDWKQAVDRYGHLFPELDQAIAKAFSEQLSAARSDRESKVAHASFGNG